MDKLSNHTGWMNNKRKSGKNGPDEREMTHEGIIVYAEPPTAEDCKARSRAQVPVSAHHIPQLPRTACDTDIVSHTDHRGGLGVSVRRICDFLPEGPRGGSGKRLSASTAMLIRWLVRPNQDTLSAGRR